MSWKGGFSGIALKKQAQYYIDRQRFDTANSVSAEWSAALRDYIPTI
jgi:hypothetical protein